MIHVIDDYVIDADEKCYIMGRLKKSTNKKTGEVTDIIAQPRYYMTVSQAIRGVCDDYKRREIKDTAHTVASAVQAFTDLENTFKAILDEKVNG